MPEFCIDFLIRLYCQLNTCGGKQTITYHKTLPSQESLHREWTSEDDTPCLSLLLGCVCTNVGSIRSVHAKLACLKTLSSDPKGPGWRVFQTSFSCLRSGLLSHRDAAQRRNRPWPSQVCYGLVLALVNGEAAWKLAVPVHGRKDGPASGIRRIYASSSISWRKECRRSTWLPLPGFALTEPGSRPTCVVFADAMSAPKTEVIGLLHGHLLLPHLLSHYLSHQQVLVPKCWAKKRDGQKGTTQQSRHECRETNEG